MSVTRTKHTTYIVLGDGDILLEYGVSVTGKGLILFGHMGKSFKPGDTPTDEELDSVGDVKPQVGIRFESVSDIDHLILRLEQVKKKVNEGKG